MSTVPRQCTYADMEPIDRTFRFKNLAQLVSMTAAGLFATGLYSILRAGEWSLAAFILFINVAGCTALAFFLRNHKIQLQQGNVILYGITGRETRRVPFSEIVWVECQGGKGSFWSEDDGWICYVTTKQGPFTFSDHIRGHLELAAILDTIARVNPSVTERNLERSKANHGDTHG